MPVQPSEMGLCEVPFGDAEGMGRKRTRREVFLAEMDQVVPWKALLALIEPHYPQSGRPGRQPYPLATMLRIHFLQQWYALSDPAMEEASGSLGATAWDTFRRILLPLAAPGIVMGAVFAFITSFDLYTISLLLKPVGGNTLPLALFDFLTYEFRPTAAAAATLSILLSALGVALIQKIVGLQRAF